MTLYSYSRLNQFDNCPFAYNLHYNEGYRSPYTTIEAFMGSMVHETLELLYTKLQDDEILPLEELLGFYEAKWFDSYDPGLTINNSRYSDDEQRDIGAECISRYYERMHPFDQIAIAGLETDDVLDLPDGNTYSVRIDKFGFRDGVFYVCDYKTSGRMKSQWDADNDPQLAMYAVWVKRRYGRDKRVRLVWHMLKFDEDVESERTNSELDREVRRTVDRIAMIERCDRWETREGPLCGWCVYRHMCPRFSGEGDEGAE